MSQRTFFHITETTPMTMLVAIASVLLLAGAADSACLTINDFNRDALAQPVSFSTIGEMYGDDNSIGGGGGGVFHLQGGQLVVQPPSQKASYWFMEFEPHCIVPSSNPIRSSNRAYASFGNAVALVFDVQAAPGADLSLLMSGGDFAQCDAGHFVTSEIRLSSRHQPDGAMHTVSIPLSAWDNGQLRTAAGLHSIAFSFAPNPSNTVYRFDNVRLCDAGAGLDLSTPNPTPQAPATPSPAPMQTPSPAPMQSIAPEPDAGSPKANEIAAQKQPQEGMRSTKTENGKTSDALSPSQVSILTVLAIAAAAYLVAL